MNGLSISIRDGGQMMHSCCNWYSFFCVRNSMGCWNSIRGCSYFLCVMLGWNYWNRLRHKESCFCMSSYSGFSSG